MVALRIKLWYFSLVREIASDEPHHSWCCHPLFFFFFFLFVDFSLIYNYHSHVVSVTEGDVKLLFVLLTKVRIIDPHPKWIQLINFLSLNVSSEKAVKWREIPNKMWRFIGEGYNYSFTLATHVTCDSIKGGDVKLHFLFGENKWEIKLKCSAGTHARKFFIVQFETLWYNSHLKWTCGS